MERTGEAKVRMLILEMMANNRVWTNSQLESSIAQMDITTAADLVRSDERKNEAIWEQLINNALARSRGNSLTSKGYVRRLKQEHYQITPEGLKALEEHQEWRHIFQQVGL